MAQHPRRTRLAPWLIAAPVLASLACAVTLAPNAWDAQRGPVIPHDTFPADCALCHLSTSWHELRPDFQFDHGAATGTPLLGAHRQVACLLCHNDRGPVQQFAVRGCAGCHVDPHQGQLGTTCERCHHEVSWQPTGALAEHQRTRFPLTGAHAAAACFQCHPGADAGLFQHADTRCESCHQSDLARATNPNHLALGYTSACERCHVPTRWDRVRFAHTAAFPLTGAHARVACESCHTGGVFGGLPTDCSSCHLDDYTAATNPNHTALAFPLACEGCHGTQRWQGATFAHPQFPIASGDHAGFDCTACHTSGNFTTFSCIDCHEHDDRRDLEDEHDDVGGYVYASPNCYACHPDGQD